MALFVHDEHDAVKWNRKLIVFSFILSYVLWPKNEVTKKVIFVAEIMKILHLHIKLTSEIVSS